MNNDELLLGVLIYAAVPLSYEINSYIVKRTILGSNSVTVPADFVIFSVKYLILVT
jgi:hypothetical protein